MSETADLLESLRRRRGEREAASSVEAAATPTASASASASVQPLTAEAKLRPRRAAPADSAVTDESSAAPATTPEPTGNAWANQAARAQERTNPARATPKRGRASMPSWDEIVFGARTDDDLG
jgi:uncharacterized membrane protein